MYLITTSLHEIVSKYIKFKIDFHPNLYMYSFSNKRIFFSHKTIEQFFWLELKTKSCSSRNCEKFGELFLSINVFTYSYTHLHFLTWYNTMGRNISEGIFIIFIPYVWNEKYLLHGTQICNQFWIYKFWFFHKICFDRVKAFFLLESFWLRIK